MSNFKVVPISKRYDFSDHDDNDDEVHSVASSSIHSTYEEKVDDTKNKNTLAHTSDGATSASAAVVAQPSKYRQSKNKLKDDVLAEVMSNIMPDIGAYDIDGMADRNNTQSNQCVRILKFLGVLSQELHEAVLSGSLSQVRRSIGKFSNPKDVENYNPALINQYDSEGRTPLSLAVKIKHFEIVDLLLEHKALPEIIDEASGRTPLMFSVLLKTIKITTLLIKNGASINFPDFKFMTALMIAAANKDIAHVQLLCKHLADVDSQDDNGWTPLHYAVMSNSTECLKFILQEGADKEIRDYQKRRPLDLAKSKNHGDCIAILCYTGSSLAS